MHSPGPNKRYSILTVYLLHLTQELTDKAFEIHDRQILNLLSKGRKAQEEIQKQNGKKLNEKVLHFTNIGQALIKAKEKKLDVFEVLESVIEWNSFVSSVEEAPELARPADFDYLAADVPVQKRQTAAGSRGARRRNGESGLLMLHLYCRLPIRLCGG